MVGRGELTEQAWQTCYDRFVRWQRDGTWDTLLGHVQLKNDAVGAIDWEVSVDSRVVRGHQHASGARRRPSRADQQSGSSIRRTKASAAAGAG